MVSNQKLFTVGNFDFRLQHLLVIGVLALSVSISMLIRSTPMNYELELFEFDPFFNYRATEYILDNGYNAYSEWIDEKTWHPFGRDVSQNSQVTLHVSTSILYQLFGGNSSLYDFVILFPMVIGSLTAIAVFAFVRVLGGTTAGLLAALMFSISAPIFTRGLVGWFKSEPLGLFFAFIAIYFFVSGIMYNKGKFSFIKLIFGGLFLTLGLSSWGGILFFFIPIILFYFILPFLKRETKFTILAVSIFSVTLIISSLLFERTVAFTSSYAGLLIAFSTGYVIICEIIKKFSNESNHLRNCFVFLVSIITTVIGIFSVGLIELPRFRYLNAANPFLTSQDPLTDSVAEHMTTGLTQSYTFLSVFIIFGLIGAWFLFSRKNTDLKIDNRIFALVLSISAFYLSSAFIRLELLASVGLIILGSIGLSILFKKIFESNIFSPTKILFCGGIVVLFLIPVELPDGKAWIDWANFTPTITNGGSFYSTTTDDWSDAMNWLKYNTPENAIIASWWDYGYWITALSDRTTLVDNATLNDWQIKKVAYSLMTTPENSWHILNSHYTEDVSEYLGNENVEDWGNESYDDYLLREKEKIASGEGESCKAVSATDAKKLNISPKSCFPVGSGLDADYIVIFSAAERIDIPNSNLFFYLLDGGGDESKKHWFAKISNHNVSTFVESDGLSPTPYFMENTALGKLIPYSIYTYVEPNSNKTFDDYYPGLVPVFIKDVKYLDSESDPFYLVYASPSFYSEVPGPAISVLIYKINPDFIP
jgi:dolichyl-diphosphooligosaccharide---protein glycosyltransferase